MSEDTDRQARLTQVAGIAVALEKQTLCPAPFTSCEKLRGRPKIATPPKGRVSQNGSPDSADTGQAKLAQRAPIADQVIWITGTNIIDARPGINILEGLCSNVISAALFSYRL